MKTVKQIELLWLKGRAIKRAFEVEHKTSVYSGILRMADLLALQPNMYIRLHFVVPIFSVRKSVKSFADLSFRSLIAKPSLAGGWSPVFTRHIFPTTTCAKHTEDPIQHRPIVDARPPASLPLWQEQRLDPCPLSIS